MRNDTWSIRQLPVRRTVRAVAALFTAALLAGCGGTHGLAHIPKAQPAPAFATSSSAPNPAKRQKSAYAHYSRGDYVRALRDAYGASRSASPDFRLPLLIGLIYDTGFDRPDLAIPEYQRFLHSHPRGKYARRLQQRICFLHRQTQERETSLALQPGAPPPLQAAPFAVYPLQPAGPRQPEPGIALGLLDMVFHGLGGPADTSHADTIRPHLLRHAFQNAHSDATPDAFSRWAGASATLTGSLIDLGAHRVQIVLRVFDAEGRLSHTGQPITGSLSDLRALYHALLKRASEGLGVPLPSPLPEPDISSPLPLVLYGQALEDYLSGRLPDAHRRLADADRLAPGSHLIANARKRAAQELAETGDSGAIADVYRDLMALPDPSEAAERRLQATHTLAVPPPTALTGTESLQPYKPSRPEVNP